VYDLYNFFASCTLKYGRQRICRRVNW